MSDEAPYRSTTRWARGWKRPFDLAGSVLLIIILSPLLAFLAVLFRLADPGSLFFCQERGGLEGNAFRLVKFRTMRADRKHDPKELVPLDHQDITALGRFLRRSKIDELPQLFNVLVGDMSLVGPRPTLMDQVAEYDDFQRQRLLVRPGMTGLAQVNSNAMSSWDERILFDVAYVRRCSFFLDLGILLRTVLVLVIGERRMTRPFEATSYARHVRPNNNDSAGR